MGGASSAPTPDPAALAAQLAQGEQIFTNTCATCHMADGNGVPNMQPGIVGSGWISAQDPQLLLSLILRGAAIMGEAANNYGNRMPPLDHLSDSEVAAVATYVRKQFAGAPIATPVTPAEVAIARARPGLPQ
jgi:mono/diheme cytochrome c family protein